MVTISVSASGEAGFLRRTSHASTILVVVPDPYQGDVVTRHFSCKPHYHVKLVTSAAAALDFTKHIKPNLVLLEYHLPDMDGLTLYDLLHETRELACIPTIISGVPLPTQALAFIKTQHLVILNTPIDLAELGRDMMQLGIPITMNYQRTMEFLSPRIPNCVSVQASEVTEQQGIRGYQELVSPAHNTLKEHRFIDRPERSNGTT